MEVEDMGAGSCIIRPASFRSASFFRPDSDSSQEDPGCLIYPNDRLFTLFQSVPVLQ